MWEARLQDTNKLIHGKGVSYCFKCEEKILSNNIPILFIESDLVEHAALVALIVYHSEVFEDDLFPGNRV